MAKRINQHDLAEHLGISQITVSRALRGHPAVAQPLRKRVEAAARKLGYRAHASASAMRAGKHGAFGLLAGALAHQSAIPPQLLWALHDASHEAGRRLLVGRLPDEDLTDDEQLPAIMREWAVDGLFVYYTFGVPRGLRQAMRSLQLPAVWINNDEPGAVQLDDEGGARQAVEHLVGLGHQRIAYLGSRGSRGEHVSSRARYRGYASAVAAAGLAETVATEQEWGESRAWLDACTEWLRRTRPTAVLAHERLPAMLVRLAAERLGWRVPEDLSLVCFAISGFTSIGLDFTCLQFPVEAMARTACERLVARDEGQRPPRNRLVPFDWTPGITTAPSPRRGGA